MIEGSLTLHPSASHGGARVADLGAEPAHARGLAGLSGERDQAGQRHVSRGHVSGGDDTAHV